MDYFRCLRCRPALKRMQRTLLSCFCLCCVGEDLPMIGCDFCGDTPSTFQKLVVMAHVHAREVDDALRDRSKSTEELQVVLRRVEAMPLHIKLLSHSIEKQIEPLLESPADGENYMGHAWYVKYTIDEQFHGNSFTPVVSRTVSADDCMSAVEHLQSAHSMTSCLEEYVPYTKLSLETTDLSMCPPVYLEFSSSAAYKSSGLVLVL
ncbi:hypothetical protein PsorP6_003560 [Peronosclerospora sorghi]|uniref:Uncharacterized protein n=1 Tax=Peronosclerospora sorghi TaxID=230839 RepID=A0ACC0VL82_9STRA|nr:hypothetical protein PsorP6_003560 [Peronosclerospora sorghi]